LKTTQVYSVANKYGLLDLIEGYHLSHAVFFLHYERILPELTSPLFASQIALDHRFDETLTKLVLTYVAERTDLIIKLTDGRFVLGARYADLGRLNFEIEQYIGTYGPNTRNLKSIIRNPTLASAYVDRESHMRAFERYDPTSMISVLVGRLAPRFVLDIGCGVGHMLIHRAKVDQSIRGWGIDSNKAMIAAGTRQIAAAGVGARIVLLQGDCKEVGEIIPSQVRSGVDLITASSLFNEMFANGNNDVVQYLKRLGTWFPGRRLLIADYYGQLGKSSSELTPSCGFLHDFVQVISGQGVPPADLAEWLAIYQAGSCVVVDYLEGVNMEFRWFAHLVQLPPAFSQ
jgi:SAM-dependent methyltransferase